LYVHGTANGFHLLRTDIVLGIRHAEHLELIDKVDLELFAREREAEFGDLLPSLQLIKVSPALASILPGFSELVYSS
jgi:hypothetical protein